LFVIRIRIPCHDHALPRVNRARSALIVSLFPHTHSKLLDQNFSIEVICAELTMHALELEVSTANDAPRGSWRPVARVPACNCSLILMRRSANQRPPLFDFPFGRGL
jgi:hypothetical protein